MKRLLPILFWSVIAAAFVGPGTVTTCAAAGAGFGLQLLWAMVFSTVGCFVLQEAAARVTLATGSSLARSLRAPERGRGVGAAAAILVSGAILLGCAAYQAGNVLGAVAGAEMSLPYSRSGLTLFVSGGAALLLWFGSTRFVARAMGGIVAIMGVTLFLTALRLQPEPAALLSGALLPVVPAGAGLLVIALVGTTIVPYNLFLGSGIAAGQQLREMRWGLGVAIGLGGSISMAVMVVGGAIDGEFSFQALASTLDERLGGWARAMLAAGLFCAGFSSAVTAPLAAAITGRDLFGAEEDPLWAERGLAYRSVWLVVILAGLGFGLSSVRPVPVIVIAQAFNGLLLPLVAGFLLWVVNDRARMGQLTNGVLANVGLVGTFLIALLLGLSNVLRAMATTLGLPPIGERGLLLGALGVVILSSPWLLRLVSRRR